MRSVTSLLAVLVLGVPALADDPAPKASEVQAALGEEFTKAVENLVVRCRKQRVVRVLLVARADADIEEELPENLIETLGAEIARLLGEGQLKVELVKVGEGEVLPDRATRVLSTRDLRALDEKHDYDVVVSATFRELRGKPTLRLALFAGSRRLSMEHAALGRKEMTAAIERFVQQRANPGLRPGVGRPITALPPSGRTGTIGGLGAGAIRIGGNVGGGTRPGPTTPGTTPGPDVGGPKPTDPVDSKPDTDPPGDDTPADPDAPTPPPAGEAKGLNAGVLRFAQQNLGKQVGNGECWTLANNALITAGARPAAGYTFGTGINRRDVTPGDILQFKSVRLERGNRYWLMGTPHHTAIVEAVRGDVVTVLHQNFGERNVTRLTFDFSDMTRGEVWAYRPRPR